MTPGVHCWVVLQTAAYRFRCGTRPEMDEAPKSGRTEVSVKTHDWKQVFAPGQ